MWGAISYQYIFLRDMPADWVSQVFLSSFHRVQHNFRFLTSYVNCNVLIDSGIGDFIKSGDRCLPMIVCLRPYTSHHQYLAPHSCIPPVPYSELNPGHPVSCACCIVFGYALQWCGFTSWMEQMYLFSVGSFFNQGQRVTSSSVWGSIKRS